MAYQSTHDGPEVDDAVGAVKGGANGFIVKTGTGASARRTLLGTAGQIAVANGDGTGGNPTASLDAAAVASLARADGALLKSGAEPMAGALTMGSNKITGLAEGTNPNDAVRVSQLPDAVDETRLINTGTGLVGGGDLSADRTIAADIASKAQAETGTDNTKLMTSLRVKQTAARLISAVPCTYGGTTNAITLTSGRNLDPIPDRLEVVFWATAANTGAMTADLDGTGAKTVKTITGASTPSGYIRLGSTSAQVETRMRWSSSEDCWIADRVAERIDNANGTAVRYANGYQKCFIPNARLTYGSTTRIDYTWIYPAEFGGSKEPVLYCVRSKSSVGAITPEVTQVIPGAFTDVADPYVSGALEYHRISGFSDFGASDFLDCSGFAAGLWY